MDERWPRVEVCAEGPARELARVSLHDTGEHMPMCRALFTLIAVLITPTVTATAQQSAAQPDSVRAEIRASLRAFYFNLDHDDWATLTAAILPAKVVANRTAPETFVTATTSAGRTAESSSAPAYPAACSSKATALIDQATITLDGDWAKVSVPRCTTASVGADEFRLIHFDGRWRFVYIHLFQAPASVSTGR